MGHTADFGAKKFKTGTSMSLTSEKYGKFNSRQKNKENKFSALKYKVQPLFKGVVQFFQNDG